MLKRPLIFALLALLTTVTTRVPSAVTASNLPTEPVGLTRAPEVKLRKLHLVRPDLIPFPIYFEVYA